MLQCLASTADRVNYAKRRPKPETLVSNSEQIDDGQGPEVDQQAIQDCQGCKQPDEA